MARCECGNKPETSVSQIMCNKCEKMQLLCISCFLKKMCIYCDLGYTFPSTSISPPIALESSEKDFDGNIALEL